MNVKGKIYKVEELKKFDTGFQKQEFILETEGQYPQKIKFETVKDKTSLCDLLAPGIECDVHFNIRGNEYEGKFYTSLIAWKIEM